MLALKRMRRRAGLFAAVFGVVLLLGGLSVGLSGYLANAANVGARAGVAALAGADGGFQLGLPVAADAKAQDARVRATIRSVVSVDGRAVPMLVARDVVTLTAVGLDTADAAPVRSALASIPGLESRARLVQGSWPTGPSEASMQADAASALDVHLGQKLTLPGGAQVTITATWRVRNAADPHWLADPIALHGADVAGMPGWVVIDPSLWAGAKVDPVARWTVRPDSSRITAAQLSALQTAPDAVSNAIQKADPKEDVREAGLLQVGMKPIQQNVQAATAVSTAPLIVVALVGLITLIELARMLEQLRSGENALLRARGGSRRRFILESAAEGVLATVPGVVLGAGGAALLLATQGAAGDIPVGGWVAAAASVVVAVVALAATAGRSARDVGAAVKRRGARGLVNNGRLRSTVGIGAVGLLVLFAVVAVSQFLLYGSPLAPAAGGGVAVDPLAVSAPALAISALGLLTLAAFPLVSRGLERWSRGARNLAALPLRELARRPRSALTPILVLAFAVSGLLVGASYAGTWSVSATQTRAAQVGTDVRVLAPVPFAASVTRAAPSQTAAAPVAIEDAQVGESLVSVVAMPAAQLAKVVTPVPGVVNPAGLAKTLLSHANRPQLATAATGVRVHIEATPVADLPTFAELTMVDATGYETPVLLLPSGNDFAGPLPTGTAPWTIRAVDMVIPVVTGGDTVAVSVFATGGSTAQVTFDDSWTPVEDGGGGAGFSRIGDGVTGVRAQSDGPGGGVSLQPSAASTLPVVISEKLAHDSGLKVGSQVPMLMTGKGGPIPVTIAGIVPLIPGLQSGVGVMADLGGIQDAAKYQSLQLISASEWWVAARDPAVAGAELQHRAPLGATVQTLLLSDAERVLASAKTVVWIAGIATALLAILVIAAGLFAELRARRPEVAVLRAVGIAPRAQARGRTMEWAMLLALGLVAGAIDGLVVCILLMPALARTAVPNAIDVLHTSLRLDVAGGLLALFALLAALAALLVVVTRTVSRQARLAGDAESSWSGDAR